MSRVFLSLPVQGQRLAVGVYDTIIRAAAEAGLVILNAEINRPPEPEELGRLSPRVVHSHNRALLESAHIVIAEISRPSLGVGFELAVAQSLDLPVLALCSAASLRSISLMIRGIEYDGFHLRSYGDTDELENIINDFVKDRFSNANLRRMQASNSAIATHFDELAPIYDDATEWRQNEPLLGWIRARTEGIGTCLDVGTGTGLVGASIARGGVAVVGVDRSERMLRRAAARIDSVVQGDVTSLPFRNAAFDCAVLRSLLHYVDDLLCLQEVRRILRHNGRLICAQSTGADIDAAAWWERLKALTHPLRQRFYTATVLEQRLVAAGFEIREVSTERIARRETWGDVFRHCHDSDRDFVRAMIREAPAAVRDSSDLQVSGDGITYRQHWTLIAATPAEERA